MPKRFYSFTEHLKKTIAAVATVAGSGVDTDAVRQIYSTENIEEFFDGFS